MNVCAYCIIAMFPYVVMCYENDFLFLQLPNINISNDVDKLDKWFGKDRT